MAETPTPPASARELLARLIDPDAADYWDDAYRWPRTLRIADRILAALPSMGWTLPAAAGWVSVPREPTPQMVAAFNDRDRQRPKVRVRDVWASMLAAAPAAAGDGVGATGWGRPSRARGSCV